MIPGKGKKGKRMIQDLEQSERQLISGLLKLCPPNLMIMMIIVIMMMMIMMMIVLDILLGHSLGSSRKSVHERPRNSDGWQVK